MAVNGSVRLLACLLEGHTSDDVRLRGRLRHQFQPAGSACVRIPIRMDRVASASSPTTYDSPMAASSRTPPTSDSRCGAEIAQSPTIIIVVRPPRVVRLVHLTGPDAAIGHLTCAPHAPLIFGCEEGLRDLRSSQTASSSFWWRLRGGRKNREPVGFSALPAPRAQGAAYWDYQADHGTSLVWPKQGDANSLVALPLACPNSLHVSICGRDQHGFCSP
jgi:hypothetical protein